MTTSPASTHSTEPGAGGNGAQLVRLRIPARAEYITLGRHAYRDGRDGVVEILYQLQSDRLVIEVSDDGPGFDYVEAEGEDRELTEGGLGLAIIRSLSDEFEFGERNAGGGSRLRF